MKSKHLLLLASFATLILALPAMALEPRTFRNADKTKSFKGTLADYNSKKKSVTVQFASGNKKTFPLSVLCKEDQDYVLSKQDVLTVSRSVWLRFEEKKVKSGEGHDTSYDIEVRNNGKNPIEDVQLKYTLYYDQGDLNKGGTIRKTKSGTLATGKMYDSDSMRVTTSAVNIVRKSRAASGGG